MNVSFYPYEKSDVFYNMALDEVLFKEGIHCIDGFIRIYSFESACMTIGYFQKAGDNDKKWTRRITGGGIVEHGNDIVLSLGLPAVRQQGKISILYKKIHDDLLQAVLPFLPGSEIIGEEIKTQSSKASYCFISPVQYDIKSSGNKVIGGAISLKKNRFLYQGSLQIPELVNEGEKRSDFFNRVMVSLSKNFGFDCHGDVISEKQKAAASILAAEKYSAREWREKF